MTIARDVLAAVKSVVPRQAPLHEPVFNGTEWDCVKECIDTGWVSSAGSFVGRFEEKLCEITGAQHAIAVVNGTAALHMSLLLSGISPEDEVILPALTFVATANAISYCGAVPHFADVEFKTLGIDPEKLSHYLNDIGEWSGDDFINKETKRPIRALVCVHAFGHPADIDGLTEVCQKFRINLIEDAAESLGSYYKGRHTGNFGKLAALSFNGNKIITTGGGGAIITNDERLAQTAKHITTTAKKPHKWEFLHDRVGFNYRMPNINAALGCAQLEQLESFVAQKRELAKRYAETLNNVTGVSFVSEPENCCSNYWLNVFLLDRADMNLRDKVLETLNDAGLMSRPAWMPLHLLEMFASAPRMDLAATEDLYARLINIPSSANLAR